MATEGRGRSRSTGRRVLEASLAVVLGTQAMGIGCSLQDKSPEVLFLIGIVALGAVDHNAVEGGAPPRELPKAGGGAVDSMVSVRNGGATAGFGFQSSPFDLHPPFRWEVTAGRLDPASAGATGGFFCTELDARGSSPLEFYALCAEPFGDGYRAWVSARGTGLLNVTTFPATAALDLAVEHDGAVLRFYVRPSGPGEYVELTTLEPASAAPLLPSVGVAQLPPGGQFDFDNHRIVTNGPLPPGATQAQVLARDIADAGLPLTHSAHDLDRGLDPTAVAAELSDAAAALADSEATLAAATSTADDPAAVKKARKQVRAARKAAGKAASLVSRGRPAKSVAKTLQKGARAVFSAALLVDPRPLPGT